MPILGQRWEREALSPAQLLSRGVQHGLTSQSDDPGQSAGDHVMTLAVQRPIETPQSDLLSLAEHTSSLADFIVWMLREGAPWERPDPVMLGKHLWQPESFIGPGGLRRVVLVDRWPVHSPGEAEPLRITAERFDWATLEAAIYDMPMTLVVVVLGASRDGRRHGPLSKGWLHPVAGDLRFRKRDQTDFGATWNQIYRESFRGDREEWLESMTEDRVLDETIILYEVPQVPDREAILGLAETKMARLADTAGLPSVQLQQCFDPIRQCPFRSVCPYFRLPSESNGFLRV